MNKNNRMPQMPERESWEQNTYQTGSTCPPKNYRGVIAVLLAAVIFLGGIVSALGLMNIRLFRQLQIEKETEAASLRFAQESTSRTAVASDDAAHWPALGFYGQDVSTFYRLYYRIPQGLYITYVAENSNAAANGVVAGDILLALDGVRVVGADSLETLLQSHSTGETVSLLLYRNGHQFTQILTLGEC